MEKKILCIFCDFCFINTREKIANARCLNVSLVLPKCNTVSFLSTCNNYPVFNENNLVLQMIQTETIQTEITGVETVMDLIIYTKISSYQL